MPNAENSLSLLDLILHADLIVKLVMLFLFGMSVASWAIILLKRQLLLQAQKQNELFLNGFWGGWTLSEAFTKTTEYPLSPIAKSFKVGVAELRRWEESPAKANKDGRSITLVRALKKSNMQEISNLEASISWLAATASAAPFIGLFGTVWGIMNSFQAIGSAGSANLAVVAPGISEALIATCIGLAAAIPASICYNYLMTKLRAQAQMLESFNQDFLNMLQREGNL